MTYLTAAVLICLLIAWKIFLVVPTREAVIVERLGKFRAVLAPGLHILWPIFDRVAYFHEMREQVLDVSAQTCITRDNIQVEVDGLVYLKVMDAKKSSYGIGDYRLASVNLAQTTMRAELGKLTLGQTFSERESLNEAIVREVDKASNPWGIKVLRYEIKNINPSAHVVHTLEKQMEAERAKRAQVTMATAQKECLINISEGERQEAVNLSMGEKQKRINESKGRAREISIVAEATAEAMQQVALAISKPKGTVAVKMRLVEQFINDLGQILGSAKVSVLPTTLANISGFLEGIGQLPSRVESSTVRHRGN